jgi:putative ABC transport system permease protein
MVLGLSIGCGFIIWDLNFSKSGSKEVMNEFLSQYCGKYHVSAPGFYRPENRKEFDIYRTLTDRDIPDAGLFKKATRRVTAPVFVSGKKKTLGVLLTGLDVKAERQHSFLHKAVTKGRFLNESGHREIIIGKKFAQKINVDIGDEVGLIGQALDGSVANDLFVVVGLLDYGGGGLEESLALTQFQSAQELFAMASDRYHVLVNFDMESEEIPSLKNLDTIGWTELLPEIGSSIRFVDKFTWLVSIIIMVVVCLGLSNSLMITFLERDQEFRALNIIGARSSWIVLSLIIESFMMGAIAIVIGISLGYIATTFFNIYPINIEIFTGGKPIILGGLTITPRVRLYSVPQYYWQAPLMICFFLGLTIIYPLIRVMKRGRDAI